MNSPLKFPSVATLFLTVMLNGCGKDSKTPEKSAAPKETSTASISLTAPSAPPAPIAPHGSASPVTVGTDSKPMNKAGEVDDSDGMDVGLKALNEALQEFQENMDRMPDNLNELVAKKYLRTLPSPPAGKQYYIDKDKKMIGLK